MEKKLKKLFDYQRFEKNERLEKIIKETESRYGGELSDDELSFVNAAGEPTAPTRKKMSETGIGAEIPCSKPTVEQNEKAKQYYDEFLAYQQEIGTRSNPLEAEYESEYQKYLKWLQEQKKGGQP